jgi:hypothetical protein
MDQCSWHDTPPAFSVDLTNRSGRALRLELVVQIVLALTDQRFGDIFTKVAMSCTIRLLTSAHRAEPTRSSPSAIRLQTCYVDPGSEIELGVEINL